MQLLHSLVGMDVWLERAQERPHSQSGPKVPSAQCPKLVRSKFMIYIGQEACSARQQFVCTRMPAILKWRCRNVHSMAANSCRIHDGWFRIVNLAPSIFKYLSTFISVIMLQPPCSSYGTLSLPIAVNICGFFHWHCRARSKLRPLSKLCFKRGHFSVTTSVDLLFF